MYNWILLTVTRAQVVFPKHIFINKNRNVLPDKIVDFFYNFVSKKKVAQVTICEMLEWTTWSQKVRPVTYQGNQMYDIPAFKNCICFFFVLHSKYAHCIQVVRFLFLFNFFLFASDLWIFINYLFDFHFNDLIYFIFIEWFVLIAFITTVQFKLYIL